MNPVQIKKKIQDLAVNLKEAEEKNAQYDHGLHSTLQKLVEKHSHEKVSKHLDKVLEEMGNDLEEGPQDHEYLSAKGLVNTPHKLRKSK